MPKLLLPSPKLSEEKRQSTSEFLSASTTCGGHAGLERSLFDFCLFMGVCVCVSRPLIL
jgi:hypothetical protein